MRANPDDRLFAFAGAPKHAAGPRQGFRQFVRSWKENRARGRAGPADSWTHPLAGVDRDAPVRFLGTIFEPTDWAAIFLKSYERTGVTQRVGPVSWIQSEHVQRWLRAMNARKYYVFVSVNEISSGCRSRTRDAIGAVRHVFLDADHNGLAYWREWRRVQTCRPRTTSSIHRRITSTCSGASQDSIATRSNACRNSSPANFRRIQQPQNTRLPGFFNHKRLIS